LINSLNHIRAVLKLRKSRDGASSEIIEAPIVYFENQKTIYGEAFSESTSGISTSFTIKVARNE